MVNSRQQLEALKYFKRELKMHKRCVESIRNQDTISQWDKGLIDRHKADMKHLILAMELILELK